MANWNEPTGVSIFSDFLSWIKALAVDAATFFVSSPTNQPIGAMKYDRATNKFQEWNGSTWIDKVVSLEGGGTGATTAIGARSAIGLGSIATLDTVGDAQITDVFISKVTGRGALASLNTVGDAQITDVALSKVTGAGTLAGLNAISDTNISTPIGLTKGGTGASDASGARTSLGLGSIATQNSNNVNISGGSVVAPNVADTGNNTNITGLLNLTGRIGAYVTVRGDALTPLSAGGANLGDGTYDFNGVRCRAIAAIAGETLKIYDDYTVARGVTCNFGSAVSQFTPINNNETRLGMPGLEWAYIYTINSVVVSSDQRLKSEIRDVQGCLNLVEQMQPKKYIKHEKEEFGLLAQELEKLVPEAVSKGDDGQEVVTPWGIQYEMLIPILIGAIKELKKEIEELKK